MNEQTHEMQEAHDDSGMHVHVVPVKVLLMTWGALILLTVITVAVTYVDLGSFNIWLAMLIAVVKATLVGLYFMHLRWDFPFHGVVFLGALAFVFLFVAIVMMDTIAYQPDLIR